nr:unnamed protein product [Digitaria exilis]
MLLNLQGFARCFIGSTSAPAAVSPPDNDDLLREILLRVPPLPSSLPRASLVCKRWRRLVSDPGFLRRYQEHHRTPPLLGYFFTGTHVPVFTPTLAPPNRITPARFSLPQQPAGGGDRLFFLGCRHGLVLLINRRRLEAIVWDPVTRRQATVAYPEEFTTDNGDHCCRGAVLSGEEGAGGLVPGEDGQLRPFKDRGLGVALLSRLSIQLWGRKVDSGGGIGWVLQKTIQVDKLLPLPPSMDNNMSARILGYDEDSNAIHLSSFGESVREIIGKKY